MRFICTYIVISHIIVVDAEIKTVFVFQTELQGQVVIAQGAAVIAADGIQRSEVLIRADLLFPDVVYFGDLESFFSKLSALADICILIFP